MNDCMALDFPLQVNALAAPTLNFLLFINVLRYDGYKCYAELRRGVTVNV